MLKNHFYEQVQIAESNGATAEELTELLGKARAKKGMFEGSLQEGELEIGQVSGMINNLLPASQIVIEIWNDFLKTCNELGSFL